MSHVLRFENYDLIDSSMTSIIEKPSSQFRRYEYSLKMTIMVSDQEYGSSSEILGFDRKLRAKARKIFRI